MNLDKSKKRIAKRVKMGFQGFPTISLAYFGQTVNCANGVLAIYTFEEGAESQEERFLSKVDAREDEVIQSAIVKMIERSGAKTVLQIQGVTIIG
jgi:hypothetical protein